MPQEIEQQPAKYAMVCLIRQAMYQYDHDLQYSMFDAWHDSASDNLLIRYNGRDKHWNHEARCGLEHYYGYDEIRLNIVDALIVIEFILERFATRREFKIADPDVLDNVIAAIKEWEAKLLRHYLFK